MENIILYYSFDVDDNLLFLDTKILLRNSKNEEVPIPTDVYAKYSSYINEKSFIYDGQTIEGYILNDGGLPDSDLSFKNFTDKYNSEVFIEDLVKAINRRKFAPSWDDFIKCLVNGSLFSIITARGHMSGTIRRGVEYIIDHYLTSYQRFVMYENLLKFNKLFKSELDDITYSTHFSHSPIVKKYLDSCEFIGVTSPERFDGKDRDIPKLKNDALLKFIDRINNYAEEINYKAKIGFSDDDPKNIKNIKSLFDSIDHGHVSNIIGYVIKNTHNPDNIKILKGDF